MLHNVVYDKRTADKLNGAKAFVDLTRQGVAL